MGGLMLVGRALVGRELEDVGGGLMLVGGVVN